VKHLRFNLGVKEEGGESVGEEETGAGKGKLETEKPERG